MVIDSLLYEIGIDPKGLQEGLAKVRAGAQQVDSEFNGMAARWGGAIQGLLSTVVAPIAGAFAIGKVINSYMSDVADVATLTGAYNQKLDEWRIKRAQLARVTKEDIALYKQYKEAMTGFNIAIADVSAKLMRTFSPVMKLAVEGLQNFTKWINRNQDNIVRFLTVTAGVLTGIFLPAIIKTGAALLMSPLTWLIGALGVLVIIVDDLTTYLRGGQSALSGFWSYFGSGPEIMAKLNAAFETFKKVISVIWKPLALIAAGFAAFKIGAVLVKGFISVLTGLKGIMTALAAHPLMAALMALVGLIVWVSDAFKRAGGDWSKVMGLMAQDLRDFLNLFGGLGDYLAEALADFMGFFSAVGTLIETTISTIFNLGKVVWAYLSGAPDEVKDALVDGLANAFAAGAQALNDFLSALLGAVYALLQNIGNAIASLGGLLVKGLSAAFDGLITLIGRVLSLIAGLATSVFKGAGAIIARMAGSIAKGFAGLFNGFVKLLTDIFGPIPEFLAGLFSGVATVVSTVFTSIADAFIQVDAAITNAIKALYHGVWEIVYAIGSAISGAFGDTFEAIGEFCTSIANTLSAIGDAVLAAFSAVWAGIVDGALGVFEGIKDAISAAMAWVVSGFEALGTAISALFIGMLSTAQNIWGALGAFVAGIASSVSKLWSNATQTISNLFTGALEGVIAGFKGVLSFFSKASNALLVPFHALEEFAANVFEGIKRAVIRTFGSLQDALAFVSNGFSSLGELARNAFALVVSALQPLIDTLMSFGAQVSEVFNSVVDIITGAFDAGLNAALEFFNSIFEFFAQIPARIAQAFDISGLISGATDKLKGIAGDAMGSVKSFFGFGDDAKAQEENIRATKQAVQTVMQDINTGAANNAQLMANTPPVANTSSITNSTYNNDNRRSDNKQNVNNTININVPNGTDARGIVREAQKSFHNLNASNNMVMASEYGNYNN